MAIADDISVAVGGDIRYTGNGSTYYTVLEFKTFLGQLLDDEQASGDDLADITTETIYERSTDEILELNSPYNIDATLAEHLYDGSITQAGGDDIYSGIYVVGVVESGTEPMIVQDNVILTPYWGTGINADAAENVIMKIMIKTRSGGADINSQKVRVLAREFGDGYAEFDVTLGLANSTAAIFTSNDLNNEKTALAIEAYFGTIVNTEGFQELNIDGFGAAGQEFYSKWDTGGQSLNDVYEYTKWVQKRAELADSNTETGDDYTVDDATNTGIGQEFSARDNAQLLVEARFKMKVGLGTPTGTCYAELFDSDDGSPAKPTGSVLATSESHNVNRFDSTHQEVIFRFTDGYSLVADQEYFIVVQHLDGSATDYLEIDGDATSGDDGNYAYFASAVWNAVATQSLWFEVTTSPAIHGIPGELFRGITNQIGWDNGGVFTEDEILFWGTKITYDNLQVSTFQVGEYVKIYNEGTTDVIMGGKVLKDAGSILTLMLEDITGGVIADNDIITGLTSGSTADIATTIVDDDKAGGEGLLIALDDNTGSGEVYIQVITGAAPVEDLEFVGRSSAATADATAVLFSRTISPAFVGQSTGTNIIGAYGIGFDPDDIGSSDKFFDLANAPRTPPNNVTFTVSGLVSSEDRILVAPRTGASMNKALYTLNTALNGGAETAIVTVDSIQTETPVTGTQSDNPKLRVQLNTGVYKMQPYESWTASTFTVLATDYAGNASADAGNNVFIGYIDVLADASSEAFTAVHSTNRDIIIRVRDGGGTPIKTVENSAQFTGAAQTVTINRVSDA